MVIALGYVLRRKGRLDAHFKTSISFLIMNIALPLSIFMAMLQYLTRAKLLGLSKGLLYVVISLSLNYIIALTLVKWLHIIAGRRGAFVSMLVNANTVFIGLPLNIALFGQVSMPYFLIYYVANTLSTWTLGVILILYDDPTKIQRLGRPQINWRKLFPPPLLALLVGLVWVWFTLPLPKLLQDTFAMVGNMVTPLSLIYIGIVLAETGLDAIRFDRDTVLALLGRFILSPLILTGTILAFRRVGQNVPDLEAMTLIIQSAAPGIAVLPILVGQAHGDVAYATNVVTSSTVLFVLVVPILMQLLQFI